MHAPNYNPFTSETKRSPFGHFKIKGSLFVNWENVSTVLRWFTVNGCS